MAVDRWDVERLTGERLNQFRKVFDEHFWESIPAIPGAIGSCDRLARVGYELVCVTALPVMFREARQRNLPMHGFPIDVVHATDNDSTRGRPKADLLNGLRPLAFVDDYLPYFEGVDPAIHRALILRGKSGSPNSGELLAHTDSRHTDLVAMADWWVGRE